MEGWGDIRKTEGVEKHSGIISNWKNRNNPINGLQYSHLNPAYKSSAMYMKEEEGVIVMLLSNKVAN